MHTWIERTEASELATTAVTIAEIQCGIERQSRSGPHYAKMTKAWLDRVLEAGTPQVRTFGVSAALLLARMYETPALRTFTMPDPKQKQPKTAADLAIAAIAIAEGGVMVTGNLTHFAEIGARFPLPGIYNPFDDGWT